MQTILSRVPSEWTLYAKIDLSDAYWQIPICEELRRKFAVCIAGQCYRLTALPQGFSYSPVLFQRRIERVLHGLRAFANLDDIILGGTSEDELRASLWEVAKRLVAFKFRLNLTKMEICRTSVEFLGLTLARGQYDVESYVQQQLACLPRVTNVRDLQQALGGLNFV